MLAYRPFNPENILFPQSAKCSLRVFRSVARVCFWIYSLDISGKNERAMAESTQKSDIRNTIRERVYVILCIHFDILIDNLRHLVLTIVLEYV